MMIGRRSIKLSIKYSCDFCSSKQLDHAYTPIRSARGMEVYVCGYCGLVQSFSTMAYQSRPPGSMSADADRSSYRYTKDVISDRYDKCFTQCVDFTQIQHILDVGSNRGAFIKYLEANYPGKEITGVEPDNSITDSYSSLPNVEVQKCRLEHSKLPDNHFDFAYCAHTLEHADSARDMLLRVRRALKPGGLFFVAVPNLIFYDDIIEELFIDPHTFHFNFNLLRSFVQQIGFSVEYSGGPKEPDLVLLLKRQEVDVTHLKYLPNNLELAQVTKAEIDYYKKNIHRNRAALKDAVESLYVASKKYKVVIWGGGRIFDALIRFGDLDIKSIHMVVDKYLFRYVSKINGIRLDSPAALLSENPNDILIFIASRNYADEIRAEAGAIGITKFIQFGKSE
jgi:SAM-dependent methyltransferase